MDNVVCNELPVLFLLFYEFIFYSEDIKPSAIYF